MKRFSCKVCGRPFDAFPPDDLYVIANLEEKEGSVKRTYICDGLGSHDNIIYWTKRRKPKIKSKK